MEEDFKSKPRVGVARSLARKLLKEAGIKNMPVSLEIVIKCLQRDIDLQVLSHDFGKKVSGMLVVIGDHATIGFNKDQHWHRKRFTIAHEVGHLLLSHTCNHQSDDNYREVEANEFAAELLMPLGHLKEDFKKVEDLKLLSQKYIVSEEAMCRHIMNCKILN